MNVVVLAAAAWIGLALVAGLLIGGAVRLDERTAMQSRRRTAGPGSRLLGERSLDGEGEAGTLQVHEQGSPVV
jgi:hypothetical protein